MQNFYKYHGAGNDFILIDNRDPLFDKKDIELIKLLCHRRFGVGADGIMLLEEEPGFDFRMVYINSDGSTGAMCGNGGRCIVHFAHNVLKIIKNPKEVYFMAVDGEHKAEIDGDIVKLKMQNVSQILTRNNLPFLFSGTTPHNVMFVEDIENFPVVSEGRKIRYSDPNGVNTNFTQIKDGVLHVRTYERGVEDETMACGTGSTSVAIAAHHLGLLASNVCTVQTRGGKLLVEFEKKSEGNYDNIWLTGPACLVFKGLLN